MVTLGMTLLFCHKLMGKCVCSVYVVRARVCACSLCVYVVCVLCTGPQVLICYLLIVQI